MLVHMLTIISTLPTAFLLKYEASTSGLYNRTFPEGFIFGASSAAYQIEGGWNADGKGESNWDRFTHEHPEEIMDGSNGDVACDSYHKYLEDVEIVKGLGAIFYRFSIEWSRILPYGIASFVNQKGIDYYNTVIDAVVANGLEPMVTIHHLTTPQYLDDLGGWVNEEIVGHFTDFARILFENYGDRVKYWITFNEPAPICQFGYGSINIPPGLGRDGLAEYKCGHNMLKAHAAAWHLYDEEFRKLYNGMVGITLDSDFAYAASDDEEDLKAQERELEFSTGWIANPVFGTGNYPQEMIDRIAARSKYEGFSASRLPTFTLKEIEYIKGSSDFFGLNHYTSEVVRSAGFNESKTPSFQFDKGTVNASHPSWEKGGLENIYVVPEGFRQNLIWLKNKYNNPPIIVTENGYGDAGGVDDTGRVDYFKKYLSALLEAIYEDGVNVIGYSVWAAIDTFEWSSGYTAKFGLYAVNFGSEDRTRTPKKSAEYYRKVIASKCILEEQDGECWK